MTTATAPLATEPKQNKAALAQAVVVASSFSLLLAGTNAVNPLLPLYRTHLGSGPLTISLTFVCYVAVLIIVLLLFTRQSLNRWAPVTICASLLIAAGSDLWLVEATEQAILIGRAIAGIAGGAGTGAAAALVVVAIGSSGRSLTATGNLVGAVAGTVLAQASVAITGTFAMIQVPLIYSAACLSMAILLVALLAARRKQTGQH